MGFSFVVKLVEVKVTILQVVATMDKDEEDRGRGRGTSMPSVHVRQLDQAETSIQARPFRRTKLGGNQIGHASKPNSENVPLPKISRPGRV
ncbi:unnamed protein product [Prunus armeniaca]|uniref:Uncharacterized protein n=1 Tax=Prunus armeniaca TaxID=36596 RepID=A0A6J5XJT8_PRUAR|nr:unnamed protein product [Prunus armeniaca]